MLLSVHQISKVYNDETLFEQIQFTLDNYEKMAIVGNNGTGKTTLLKMIIGEIEPTEGMIYLNQGQRLGYLSQYQEFDKDLDIHRTVYQSQKEIVDIENELKEIEKALTLANQDELDRLILRQQSLLERFRALDGYAYPSEVIGVLKGLGFIEEDFQRPVYLLSGGEKTRLTLACILLKKPDLLILDEPTNHLDIDSVKWLELYLKSYKGAILVVSHDRYFLDQFVEKVYEIDQGKGYLYPGNYSKFRILRQARIAQAIKAYENQQKMIKHQEEVIDKLKSFNREKSIKRANSRIKQLEKIDVLEKPNTKVDNFRLDFKEGFDSGKDVLHIQNLSKSFDHNQLLKDISIHIRRGEHIALIGGNGSGKTTLLKMILGEEALDDGEIRLGKGVVIGYYSQHQDNLNPKDSIFDAFSNVYPHMTHTQVRHILAAFLFTEDDVYKKIEMLSGGEKARVHLSILMMSQANFLILDEPTNHLDMQGKEVLEKALNNYPKTILFVSHDRYFINQTAQKILHIEDKDIKEYLGNYDHFLEKFEKNISLEIPTEKIATSSKEDWTSQKKQQSTIRKLENDIKKAEQNIEKLEEKLEEIQNQMNDPTISSNSDELYQLSIKYEENQKLLEEQMLVWEKLETELSKLC